MAIRSVDEIINLSDSSKNPEKLAFKDLVKHIDPRIRERAPRHTNLHFVIPGILWGQPVFDAGKVEKMIVRHYTSMGFKCTRLGQRQIKIQWRDDNSQQSKRTDSESESESDSNSGSDSESESESDQVSESSGKPDSSESTQSSDQDTTESESTDSDGNGEGSGETKCVTVEQIPLSKRLSIINNQMQNNM